MAYALGSFCADLDEAGHRWNRITDAKRVGRVPLEQERRLEAQASLRRSCVRIVGKGRFAQNAHCGQTVRKREIQNHTMQPVQRQDERPSDNPTEIQNSVRIRPFRTGRAKSHSGSVIELCSSGRLMGYLQCTLLGRPGIKSANRLE